ncbi:MAG TPA: DNRLRE domain-containing protein [Humisphaera sp.]|jgi:hypothetical protein|nr:DNRLRE domain-containing protein [Humisphaera sp.]
MQLRNLLGITGILICLAQFNGAAIAGVVTIGAAKDATIYKNNPNNSNGAGPAMFAGTDGSGLPLRSLLQFDIGGHVPAGSTITSVQLTLYLGMVAGGGGGQADSTPRSIELHALSDSWGEGTTESGVTSISLTGNGAAANPGDATWNDGFFASASPVGWTTPGGDFAAAASATTVVNQTLNSAFTWGSTAAMVADVQGWLDSQSSNNGWALINASESTARTYRAFWTREASGANAGFVPQLQITFTPEPAVVMPATLVMLGLLGRKQRRFDNPSQARVSLQSPTLSTTLFPPV